MNIRQYIKRKKWLLVVVLLVVAFIIVGMIQFWRHDNPTPKIAADTDSVANDYLISKVGYDNFKKLYRFDKARGGYAGSRDSNYDFVAYHFAPFKMLNDQEDVIMVQVNRYKPSEIFMDGGVPECKKDKSLCDFKVTREQALQIARDNAITADDIWVDAGDTPEGYAKKKGLAYVIEVKSCKQSKSVFIDYRNGSVVGRSNAACEDIEL